MVWPTTKETSWSLGFPNGVGLSNLLAKREAKAISLVLHIAKKQEVEKRLYPAL